jgi:hypothetical protein
MRVAGCLVSDALDSQHECPEQGAQLSEFIQGHAPWLLQAPANLSRRMPCPLQAARINLGNFSLAYRAQGGCEPQSGADGPGSALLREGASFRGLASSAGGFRDNGRPEANQNALFQAQARFRRFCAASACGHGEHGGLKPIDAGAQRAVLSAQGLDFSLQGAGLRPGRSASSCARPGFQLLRDGDDGIRGGLGLASHRQAGASLPALHGANALAEILADFLPRCEKRCHARPSSCADFGGPNRLR